MESNIWQNFALVFKHLAELGTACERWYQKNGVIRWKKKKNQGLSSQADSERRDTERRIYWTGTKYDNALVTEALPQTSNITLGFSSPR